MNGGNFNIKVQKKRVLLAPLDWGLGHATRCIPLIHELLRQGAEVIIGGEGAVQQLLQQEFPQLKFVPLRGYRIRYSKTKRGLIPSLSAQIPGILRSIARERKWLKKNAALLGIDMVISDNRYGLCHNNIPSVFITHQLAIQTGSAFLDRILQKFNYRYINRFQHCWIPDAEGEPNLAGKLSHPSQLPKIPVSYLGPLSRLEKVSAPQKYDCCVLISGPEPQRSVFEEMMIKELEHFPGSSLLIRGLPGNSETLASTGNTEITNHLPAGELSLALASSAIVICRSGYSTVMDLVALGKKAVLVPTPGQTEQEYLAVSLQQKGIFPAVPQHRFSLASALGSAKNFPFNAVNDFSNNYVQVIGRLLQTQ